MRDESYPGEADEAARDEASCHKPHMAHTPGPWRVGEGRSITAQFEREEVQIASMSRSSWTFPDGGKNRRLAAQMDANARLIASAPELLEALRAGP